MGNIPSDFVFSQSSLQAYVDCSRRFQLRYLLNQRYPAQEVDDMFEFEHRMLQGEQFHQFVHQHIIGIPENLLLPRIHDTEVKKWFELYLKSGFDDVPEKRYPEQVITVPLGETYLLAKFDMLAIGDSALIMDWKTSRRMPSRSSLAAKLQTIIYRYVLAKGGARFNEGKPIDPEKIVMRYWFAAQDGQTINFTYDAAGYEADESLLLSLIDEIDKRGDFPLTEDTNKCRFCTYRSLCERGTQAGSLDELEDTDYNDSDLDDFNIDIEQIAEIEF